VVAVRSANLLGIAFHPEIAGETRIHQYFVKMIQDARSRNPKSKPVDS
jgi:5'-phosphate synthase pdxT subunit